MEVILLQDVKSLGKKGQIVKINDGYARNYVLPKKLGLEANAKNLNDLRLDIDKKKMKLEESIKTLGTYEVPVKLHKDVTAKLRVVVGESK